MMSSRIDNLALADGNHFKDDSFTGEVNGRTDMPSFAAGIHPLSTPIVATPAESDPLFRNSDSSYSDVVFSLYDESSGNEIDDDRSSQDCDSFSRAQSPPSSSSEYIRISVSDPRKEHEISHSIVPGGNTYVAYLVTTRTNCREFGGSDFSVRRRFRDFVTLADRLAESYRGYVIPPRPDKSVVESQVMQKLEFVEQRKQALEKYLRRLVAHPVIKKSDELKVFLQVQGKLPLPTSSDATSRMLDGAAKLPKQLFGNGGADAVPLHEVVQPAKGGRDLLRLFRELRQSVVIDWGGSKPLVFEEDKEFLDKKEKMHELEQQLGNASKQAESLVKAQQDMGETLGQLGLTFIKLAKFENEEALLNSQRARAADMKGLATASVKASRLYRGLNTQTVNNLGTFHEYLGITLAAQNAFSDRASALLTVQTLLSDVSSLKSKTEKLEAASSRVFGADNSKIHKIEELKQTTRVKEDAKNVALREYERIKENNRSELERLEKERQADLLNALKGFVTSQVAYAEKIANVWVKEAGETNHSAKQSS